MQNDTRISTFFTLTEFLRSETAMIHRIDEQFTPPKTVIANLTLLAKNIADPLRIKFGAFSPDSGYRCPRLNKIIKGSKNSEHLTGSAMDEKFRDNKAVFNWIINGGLPKWSKLIYEFPEDMPNFEARWLHIGYNTKALNKEVYVAVKRRNQFGQMVTQYIEIDKYEHKNRILI